MHRMLRRLIALGKLIAGNLWEEVHLALHVQALRHGQSMEAEMPEILEWAIGPKGRVTLGSLLADMGRQARLSDEEFAVFEGVRDKAVARPVSFE